MNRCPKIAEHHHGACISVTLAQWACLYGYIHTPHCGTLRSAVECPLPLPLGVRWHRAGALTRVALPWRGAGALPETLLLLSSPFTTTILPSSPTLPTPLHSNLYTVHTSTRIKGYFNYHTKVHWVFFYCIKGGLYNDPSGFDLLVVSFFVIYFKI